MKESTLDKFRIVATLFLETLREYGMFDVCVVLGFLYCIVLALLFFQYERFFDRTMTVIGFVFYATISVKMSNFRHKWKRGAFLSTFASVIGFCIVVLELFDYFRFIFF